MAADGTTIRELAERHWNGEGDLVHAHHPVTPVLDRAAEEIAPGVLTMISIASVNAIDTGDGLVMLDTGGQFDSDHVFEQVRGWRPEAPVRAAVYSHHHIDHVFGTRRFEAEAAERGWPPPVVYAHEELPDHFRRYERTLGWNTAINKRQFALPVDRFPGRTTYRYPDVTYRDHLTFTQGDADVRAAPRPRRDRRRDVDVGARAGASSTPATCSSGRCRTPATRRRCSASPATGRSRCGRWPGAAPR